MTRIYLRLGSWQWIHSAMCMSRHLSSYPAACTRSSLTAVGTYCVTRTNYILTKEVSSVQQCVRDSGLQQLFPAARAWTFAPHAWVTQHRPSEVVVGVPFVECDAVPIAAHAIRQDRAATAFPLCLCIAAQLHTDTLILHAKVREWSHPQATPVWHIAGHVL
jgi:hypothetical protein